MEPIHDQDLIKIKELLRHTGEFIAYFELADSKMSQWRHDIENLAQKQQQHSKEQLQNLHQEIESLQEALTQAGLARLRLSAEQALKQGQAHLSELQRLSQQITQELAAEKTAFLDSYTQSLTQLDEKTNQAIGRINAHLQEYDVGQFHRIAHESCEEIKQTSKETLHRNISILKTMQWRSAALAMVTTFITAFIIGLYASSEMPWETHQQARNEREAGRVLLKAWPSLSKQEKTKILRVSDTQPS